MKIVCDACAAKYSIADDKVKGKVFKIRCKKCSNIIVVRGTAGAGDEPAAAPYDQKETRVYDYGGQDAAGGPAPGDDAVWHVVIDQEQIGPITVGDVQARFAAGELELESYVWREGFADWLPLSQVPEFASLAAGGSTTHAQSSSAGSDAVASMFGSANFEDAPGASRADPSDVFAAHAAKAAAVVDDGGDLFGDVAPPAPEAFGGGRGAAGPAPTAAGMRGQRSENSVLFSLNNLAAMAGDNSRAAPASASASTAQHGGGEGSGLIDIRSMASSYLGAKAPAQRSGPSVGSVDDIPVFSTATYHEPAVMVPLSGGARNNNKTVYVLLGAVGLLAAAAVVLVVMIMSKGDKPAAGPGVAGDKPGSDRVAIGDSPGRTGAPTGDVGAVPPPPPGPGSVAVPALTDPPTGTGAAPTGTGVAPPVKATPDKVKTDKPERVTTPPVERPIKLPPDKAAPPDKVKVPPDKPPTGGACIDEIACMLADPKPACCVKKTSGTKPPPTVTPPPATGTLPQTLGKSEISAGIAKVRGRVDACGSKSAAKGTVKVSVKVSGGGTVSAVTVKESPDGALGSCVASAVQKATFSKSQDGATFSYPFKF